MFKLYKNPDGNPVSHQPTTTVTTTANDYQTENECLKKKLIELERLLEISQQVSFKNLHAWCPWFI